MLATEYDIVLWAEERNLIKGSTPQAQMLKLVEELGELAAAIARQDKPNIVDSLGDMGVVLTILSDMHGLSFSGCIGRAYDEIKDRKGHMVDGVFVKDE